MVDTGKIKRKAIKYHWLFRLAVYLILIALLGFGVRAATNFIKPVLGWLNPMIQLDAFKNRTNILLLGVGGEGHEGGNLTDSMMLVSINLLTADTVIVSLPRDIWIDSLKAKLNTAYFYGEEKQIGSGLMLAKSSVSEITNQPIHYGLVLDFSGFERAIDIIGGIDVEVPRGFVDSRYPIPGKESAEPESARYETIEFKSGKQHLDGKTALKYVRSRHNEGEEGTDFSRAQRQQRVLLAFKDKLLQPKSLFKGGWLRQLKQVVDDSIKTDIPAASYPGIFKLALKIDKDQIRTGTLDQGSDSEDIPPLLYHPPISRYGQWILLPVGDNWEPVYRFFEEIFYQGQGR